MPGGPGLVSEELHVEEGISVCRSSPVGQRQDHGLEIQGPKRKDKPAVILPLVNGPNFDFPIV